MSVKDDFNDIYDLSSMTTHVSVLDKSLSDLRDTVRQTRSLSKEDREFIAEQLTAASIAFNNVRTRLVIEAGKLI
jgi:hypothetical protein